MPSMKSKTLHAIGNGLFRYIYKDPKRNMLRLVKVGKAFAGKMYPESTFTKPIEIISDENNVWHRFLFRGMKEVNADFLRKAVLTFGIDLGLIGTSTLRKKRDELGCNIPWVVLLDPTSACNMKCKGCWAAEYGYKSNLTLDEMRKIIRESKALGTHFFMFTGGEPLIRKKDLITLAKENPDCIFLAFTNATLIDDAFCEQLIECGNFGLALSIEGTEETNDGRRGGGAYQTTMNAMKMLKAHGCLFGTSVCYTSKNYEAVTSDEFMTK